MIRLERVTAALPRDFGPLQAEARNEGHAMLDTLAADFQRAGDWCFPPNIHNFATQVGAVNDKVLTELLVDLIDSGWLLMEKYSEDAGRYLPFREWKDIETFFYQGASVRMRVTIPGRRRKEALEAKGQATNVNTTP